MPVIERVPIPQGSFLERYQGEGSYADCYLVHLQAKGASEQVAQTSRRLPARRSRRAGEDRLAVFRVGATKSCAQAGVA
ncbi:hypothetical protein [Dokdonella immobilis]|uniref:Uncharacterized protein n=1 Tax=Dokdonella immobilis TaxID=578942 RepID=A0A1I4XNM8_9GAMM|nr:hypothetical protein [Dokdonella immobilis]SFN27441.1 hypothetical protein SAMN05216289_11114 [Dokdonella immobilis]